MPRAGYLVCVSAELVDLTSHTAEVSFCFLQHVRHTQHTASNGIFDETLDLRAELSFNRNFHLVLCAMYEVTHSFFLFSVLYSKAAV